MLIHTESKAWLAVAKYLAESDSGEGFLCGIVNHRLPIRWQIRKDMIVRISNAMGMRPEAAQFQPAYPLFGLHDYEDFQTVQQMREARLLAALMFYHQSLAEEKAARILQIQPGELRRAVYGA